MARLFGTDGVRGIANQELTSQLAFLLGQAAVVKLGKNIVIGKDTRLSGDMLEASVIAGITSAGGTALLAGYIPTPAIALLTRQMYCDAGVMISASHNPPEYNGIKLFNAQGFKLTDEQEDDIEAFVRAGGLAPELLPDGTQVGCAFDLEDASEIYINHVIESLDLGEAPFAGIRLVVDCGHGASSYTTPETLERLGAEVIAINTEFNGVDINVDCGSTHLDCVTQTLLEHGADLGIAHDGDADRVMFVAKDGSVLDGDVVLAVCAQDLQAQGKLAGDTVVSTVMCNLGLVRALEAAGIQVVQTKVGDRYVLEHMRSNGNILGGEQSGHTIFLEHNSTGDGLMTAVHFIASLLRRGGLESATKAMVAYPQTLINVRLTSKEGILAHPDLQALVAEVEADLGDEGRVLIRESGTEPVIRVMVEASSAKLAQSSAEKLAHLVKSLEPAS